MLGPRRDPSEPTSCRRLWFDPTLFILSIAGAVDAADARVLPSLFHALEGAFGYGPEKLSGLMVGQSLAMAVVTPVWGHLCDRRSRVGLLSLGCVLWGVWTIAMAASQGYGSLLVCRTLAGSALAALNPISQSLVADIVPDSYRGAVFGVVAAVSNAGAYVGGVFATSLAGVPRVWRVEGWRMVLLAVGSFSLALAAVVPLFATDPPRARESHDDDGGDEEEAMEPLVAKEGPPRSVASDAHRLRRLCRMRTFQLLVLQGVFGSIPWNALSFSTLWLQHSGYDDATAAHIAAWHVIGVVCGNVLGGVLGDAAARRSPDRGRVCVDGCVLHFATPAFAARFMPADDMDHVYASNEREARAGAGPLPRGRLARAPRGRRAR